MPLQPRHAYAAGIQRGLRADDNITDEGVAAPTKRRALLSRPISTRLEPVRSIEGLSAAGSLSYTFPPRLPDPGRLAVPARPVVVRAASHPLLHLQDQAALSFTGLLRQARGGALHPHPVSWRLVAHFFVHAQHHPLSRVARGRARPRLRPLASRPGSVENLKVSRRQGWTP